MYVFPQQPPLLHFRTHIPPHKGEVKGHRALLTMSRPRLTRPSPPRPSELLPRVTFLRAPLRPTAIMGWLFPTCVKLLKKRTIEEDIVANTIIIIFLGMWSIQSRGIIAKLVQLRRGIDSQPSGALECVFLNTEQFTQVGNSQPIIAVGLRGARRKVPRGRSSEGLGGGGLVSRGRDIVSGALCPLTSPL